MINNDWPADSWNKPIDISEVRRIIKEEIRRIIKEEIKAGSVNNQSVVDAIPIEWIKLKIDTLLNIYPDGNEETEVLCKLLYDWEKENEG